MANNIYSNRTTSRIANRDRQNRAAEDRLIAKSILDYREAERQYYQDVSKAKKAGEQGPDTKPVLHIPTRKEILEEMNRSQALTSSMTRIANHNWAGTNAVFGAIPKSYNKVAEVGVEEQKIYEQKVLPVVGELLRIMQEPTQLSTIQTGDELLRKTIIQDAQLNYAFNQNALVKANMQKQKAVVEHIQRTGKFIEYDLEGIGNDITEFSFIEFDVKNKTGNPVKKYMTGLTGVSPEKAKELQALIDTYSRFGFKHGSQLNGVPEADRYKLEAIAKRGHKKTVVENQDGINILKSYAVNEDVRIPQIEDLERGLKGLVEDYNAIHNAGMKTYSFGGTKYKLYRDDYMMLRMLYDAKKRNIALSGLNVFGYDNAQINRRFNGTTGDAYLLWKRITGTGDLNDSHLIFDKTAVHREGNDPDEILANANNALETIAENPGNTLNTSLGLQARYGNIKDPATGKVITGPERYQQMMHELFNGITYAQHAAFSDTAIQGFTTIDMLKDWTFTASFKDKAGKKVDNPDYIFDKHNIEPGRTAKAGDIFYVQKGVMGNTATGGMSFVVDGMSGDIRFEGIRFDSKGELKTNKNLVAPALKSNTYAMLAGTKEISVDSAVGREYAKLKNTAGTDKLIALMFYQYGEAYEGDVDGKLKDLNVWVGTRAEAEEFLGLNPYVGTAVPSETPKTLEDWRRVSTQNRYTDTTEVSDVVKNKFGKEFGDGTLASINDSVKASNITKQKDSASNWLRSMSFNKAEASLAYLKNLNKAMDGNGDIASSAVKYLNDALTSRKKLMKTFSMFTPYGADEPLTQTIANVTYSAGYLDAVKGILKKSTELAKQLAGENAKKPVKDYYFRQIFENALAVLAEETGGELTPAQAYGQALEGEMRTGKQARSVLLDISSIMPTKSSTVSGLNTPIGTFFEIDPHETEPHWVSRLDKMLKTDNRVAAVRKLGGLIAKQYGEVGGDIRNLPKRLADMATEPSAMMLEINKTLQMIQKKVPGALRQPETKYIDTVNGPASVAKFNVLSDEEQKAIEKKMYNLNNITKAVDGRASIEPLVDQITQSLFAQTSRFDLEDNKVKDAALSDLVAHGYSVWEAEEIIRDRDKRMGATKRYIRNALTPILSSGSQVTYRFDPDQMRLELIDMASGSSFDMSDMLPKERYDEKAGRFYTQFGQSQIATIKTLGRSIDENGAETGFNLLSQIDVAANHLSRFARYATNSGRTGSENIGTLQWVMKSAINLIRPDGVTRFDHQDQRFGLMLDFMPLVKEFGYFQSIGAFDKLNLSQGTKDALLSMAGRLEYENQDSKFGAVRTLKDVKPDELEAIYKDFDTIFGALTEDTDFSKAVFGGIKGSEKAYIQSRLSHLNRANIKNPAKALASFTSTGLGAVTYAGKDNRSVGIAAARARTMDLDSFYAEDEEYEKLVRGGKAFLTEMDAANMDAGRYGSIRTHGVNIDTSVYEAAIAAHMDELSDLEDASAVIRFLNENGSIANPRLQHLFPKNINQKHQTVGLIDMDELHGVAVQSAIEAEEKIRRSTEEVIEIAKNGGKINFKYTAEGQKGWEYVQKDDIIAWDKSYVGEPSKVRADREGFLYKRYFKDGREIDEGEINEVLNRHAAEFAEYGRGVTSQGAAEIRQRAAGILANEGYSLRYIVKSGNLLNYQKVIDNGEKSVADFLTMRLGGYDKEISSLLKPVEGMGTPKTLRPTMEALKDIEHFNSFLAANGYQEIAEASLTSIGNWEGFRKRVLDEQSVYFDRVAKILQMSGFISESIYKNGALGIISTAMQEQMKGSHREGERIEARVADAIEARAWKLLDSDHNVENLGDAYKAASEEIFGKMQKAGVFKDKNGKNILEGADLANRKYDGIVLGNDLYSINVKKLDEIIAPYVAGNKITADKVDEEVRKGIAATLRFNAAQEMDKKEAAYAEGKLSKEAYDKAQEIFTEQMDKAKRISQGSEEEVLGYNKTAGLAPAADADEGILNNGHNSKGVKMTRRLTQNLNQEVMDEKGLDAIRLAYEKMLQSASSENEQREIVDRFNRRYKDFGISAKWDAESGNLTADYGEPGKLRRVNAAIIKNMEEEIVRGQGFGAVWGEGLNDNGVRGVIIDGHIHADDLRELKERGISEESINTMINAYEEAHGAKIIGMNNFLSQYSYQSSAAANEFNAQMAKAETDAEKAELIERFTKSNPDFSIQDIANLHTDRQFGQNDPFNPTNRNMIIDLGENSKQRYVAVPLENLSVMDASSGSGVISSSEIRDSIGSLSHYYQEQVNRGATVSQFYKEEFDKGVDKLLKAVVNLSVHKEGAAAQVTSDYITGSGIFKADIIRMTADNTFETLTRNEAGEITYGGEKKAFSLMNTAMVDGMSLAEHTRLGHNINATFLGEDFFLNALQDESMNNILGQLGISDSKATINNFLDNINDGGGLGLQMRQPAEYNTSVGGSYLFLDRTLSRNQARITQSTLAGQNGDKDGDLVYALLARADAEIKVTGTNENGEAIVLKSFNARINNLQKSLIENNLDVDKMGIEGLDKYSNVQLSVGFAGGDPFEAYARSAEVIGTSSLTGINRDVLALNDLDKAIRIRNEKAETMVGGMVWDSRKLTVGERNEFSETFEREIQNSEEFRQAIEQYNSTNKKEITLETLASDNLATTSDGKGIADIYLENKYGGKTDSAAYGREAEVLANQVNKLNIDEEIAAHMGRERAGIFNMNTYRTTQVAHIIRDHGLDNGLTDEDLNVINQFMVHVKESGQAAKNATATASSLEGLDTALKDFWGIGTGRNGTVYQKQPDATKLNELIDEVYAGGIKEFKKLPERMKDPETGTVSAERIKEAFSHLLPEGSAFNGELYKALRVGYAMDMSYTNVGTPDEGDMLFRVNQIRDKWVESIGFDDAKTQQLDILTKSTSGSGFADTPYTPDEFIGDLPEGDVPIGDQVRGLMSSIKKNFKGRGALAMLGFAGTTMALGMAGGAPTAPTPTQGQAQGIQQENAIYEIPSTMSMQGVQSGANQSYIINVNASTDKGRDFATTAINQAFANMPQSAGGNTMTMNIKDSSSNIGYSDIASYVSDML